MTCQDSCLCPTAQIKKDRKKDRSGHDRTKKRLLDYLKRDGALTAQQLADLLGISIPASRRHLADLQTQGMIQMQLEKPSGRGRPQHVYMLTETGESLFPKTYAQLCLEIFQHLEQLYGTGALVQVLGARTQDLAKCIREKVPAHLPLQKRLESFVTELNALGFEAMIEHDGEHWYILHRNCPHLSIARRYQELCTAELHLYTQVLGLSVTRQSRIACGQGVCRYRIGDHE